MGWVERGLSGSIGAAGSRRGPNSPPGDGFSRSLGLTSRRDQPARRIAPVASAAKTGRPQLVGEIRARRGASRSPGHTDGRRRCRREADRRARLRIGHPGRGGVSISRASGHPRSRRGRSRLLTPSRRGRRWPIDRVECRDPRFPSVEGAGQQAAYRRRLPSPVRCCVYLAWGGAPCKIRTCDLQIRSLSLYPSELRALGGTTKYTAAGPRRASGRGPLRLTRATWPPPAGAAESATPRPGRAESVRRSPPSPPCRGR